MLETGIEFFHDPDQHGWASIRIDGHWENHPIRSRPFQLFLLRTYYRETGNSPGAQAIRAALDLFEAKALFDGQEAPINLRVANHRGKLYLDLCDRAWRAVEIDATGWRIVDRPSPKFRRARGSQPLPEPERGGSLERTTAVSSTSTTKAGRLSGPFWSPRCARACRCPILVVKGEQGAGSRPLAG